MTQIVLLEYGADEKQVQESLQALGVWPSSLRSNDLGRGFVLAPHSKRVSDHTLRQLEGVATVMATPSSHPKLDAQQGSVTTFDLGNGQPALQIGPGHQPILAAGPCAAESEEQVFECARNVRDAGGVFLRGGAFKPRTNPYAFNGKGRPALEWLRAAAREFGLGLVTEVMSEKEVGTVTEYADLLQIGSRNMQNFALLSASGEAQMPVLLKRSRAGNLSEWRHAAEHLLHAGASSVIFCARGIYGPSEETRNVLDLGTVALLKHVDGHTVFVDPSHATGRRDLILPMARAALAAGADGLLIETHPAAGVARSDGPQALTPLELKQLGLDIKRTQATL